MSNALADGTARTPTPTPAPDTTTLPEVDVAEPTRCHAETASVDESTESTGATDATEPVEATDAVEAAPTPAEVAS